MRFGEFLVDRGLVQSSDVERALILQKKTGGLIGSLLVRIGVISEDSLLESLEVFLDYELLGSGWGQLPDGESIFEFLANCPIQFEWFLKHEVVIWRVGDQLKYLARNPMSSDIKQVLEYFFAGLKTSCCLARSHDLDNLLDFVKREKSVEDVFGASNTKHLRELAEEGPVIELVNNIFAQAIESDASDIHIEAREDHFDVRFRVDGVLQSRFQQPMERFPAVSSRIKLISGIDIAEKRLPQDGRLTTRVGSNEMDIRVSSVPDVRGESIVLRLLPKEREDLGLDYLGMEHDHLQLMEKWSRMPNGIVLVTGPTGSGKSTTLYSALHAANDGKKKIITVEDPVEFQLSGVTQIQAHTEIGYSFARALRAILRQDPDVIMIGEIRDIETAEIAIQSALTGHLVLSTLHTNDAVSAFSRLIDMGIEPFLVAAPLKGIQAQRLVRKLCENCSEPVKPGPELLAQLSSIGFDAKKAKWKGPKGCDHCMGTGYRGRTGIYEMIEVDPEIQKMVSENLPEDNIRQILMNKGFRSLLQDGLVKASKGITSIEEVYRIVNHF